METAHRFTKEHIEEALSALTNFAEYGQVLRAKGIVEGEDGQWIHFDYVPGEPDVRYGGQLSFMGGIDSSAVDHPGWTREEVAAEVERVCTECGKLYFIPGASQGDAFASFPGVYDALTEEIDKQSKLLF